MSLPDDLIEVVLKKLPRGEYLTAVAWSAPAPS
jgi:hypothetical protein